MSWETSALITPQSKPCPAYRITILVFLGIYTCTRCTIGSHRLISVLSEMKYVFFLIVVYTFDNLRPDQRALRDNSFQRDHMVQVEGAEGSRIAGVLAKTADVCTVVHLITALAFSISSWIQSTCGIIGRFSRWSIRYCNNNVFERLIKSLGIVEGCL